jgi:signal transduction histidine kinase/ActR/RegA family two-component response regulator
MRFFRRSLIALGIAAALPTIVFAAVGVFYLLRLERSQVENATLGRSQAIVTLADAELRVYLGALRVLTTSTYMDTHDWREFYPRVARVQSANPAWATVRLYDMDLKAEIFDLRRSFTSPRQMAFVGSEELPLLRESGEPVIAGIVLESEPLVYLHAPLMHDGRLRFVLSVAVRPQVFQDVLQSQLPAGTIAAVVDREGRFIARSHDYEHKVGMPATVYVRDAMRKGTQGFYRGVTWEGFKNFTAYYTSSWSGWSAHVAVAPSLIDTPTSWSFVVAGIAGLGSALLGGVLIVVVLRDMAERRRAEETLRQSQKMEAVGQLTGGIAHDFNNLLTAIIGNLDLIRTRGGGNERLQRNVEHALEAARRGAKLTAQLLAFSRSQRMQLAPVDLEQLLAGMSGLLAQSVGPAIELEIAIHPDARFVLSDANQLELALLNLAVNARDAMPAGGKLSISTRLAATGDVRSLTQRRYVEIRVVDQGVGMIEEVRVRAMEPFFTTKSVGQGTGLGLSQVYGIVRESGGVVYIDSAPGQGTTVRLILPFAALVEDARAAPQAVDKPAVVQNAESENGHAVLVVDDDDQVRRFIADSLRGLGYRVVDAASGTAALSLMETNRFDLLLVDFAMPGMNGVELARAAREKQSHLKVLMVSGYADSAAIDAAPAVARLLRKPFDLSELSTAVDEMLNGTDQVLA